MLTLLHFTIMLPFLFAIIVPFLYKRMRKVHTGWFVLAVPVLLFTYLISYVSKISNGQVVQESIPWIPSIDIHFTVYLDGLSLLFALLITGIGALVVLYSIYYLAKKKEKLHSFYVYLLLFMGAMLGVVLSDNVIVLYGFWELTSISSFLLIAYWSHRERSRYGALKSMLITVFGGLALLAGFILLYLMTGSFSVREMIGQLDQIVSHNLFIPAMLCILIGAFTKSAQFPFYIWLPDAMEAPTPVSAYLHSATMVKAGIYLVARLSPIFAGHALWFWLLGGIGLLTLLWGSLNAVKQTDLKAILAFSTVSQLGLIMSLLGVGSAAVYLGIGDESLIHTKAVLAAVFHLINHATFKGALFMVAGIVDHETGTRDIRKLGGLITLMPITFTIATIGAASMAGLPPLNGFLSKEMFFTGMLHVLELNVFGVETWAVLFPLLAWIASIFTFIYCLLFVMRTFMGRLQPDKLPKKPREASFGMLLSPIILGSLVVVFGLFPNVLSHTMIGPAMQSIMPSLLQEGEMFLVEIEHWHGWSMELGMSLAVYVLGTLLFLTLRYWIRLYDVFPKRLALSRFYDAGMLGAERVSNRVNRSYMTGFTRDYLAYILSFFIFVIGAAYFWLVPTGFELTTVSSIEPYELILAATIVLATITVVVASSRLTAIISVGVVGYLVSLFFVIFRAPDLALTQLIVETVSVALFLLCFYYLPKFKQEKRRVRFRLSNALIAAGVGIVVTLLTLKIQDVHLFESISNYYVENSSKEAGGNNIVNVILVDFRGFDTMLEILVLGIAALGILAMIKLRLAGDDQR